MRIDWIDAHLDDLNDCISRIEFVVDGRVDRRYYTDRRGDTYINMYKPEKEGYIFLGWLDEEGETVDYIEDYSHDRTFTASFVSKEDAIKAEEITFLQKDAYFTVGEYYRARYGLFPEDAQDKSILWTSSDDSVAEVDAQGNVRMLHTGRATITATLASGVSASYNVIVLDDRPLFESFEIPSQITMKKGGHYQLQLTIVPEEGEYDYCMIDSENIDIVMANHDGILKAVNTGETGIVVTMTYDDYVNDIHLSVEKTCKVRVIDDKAEYECVSGAGQKWIRGSKQALELIFKEKDDDSDIFEKFEGIQIDGRDIDSTHYAVSKGSLKLSVKASYLETLSRGEHVLKVLFTDGMATACFSIKDNDKENKPSYRMPLTGIE